MIEPSPKVEVIEMGSERSFGLVFATVLTIIGFWPLTGGESPRLWALVAAPIFLVLGYWRPGILRPLNVAWFRLGLLLGAVVTPAVMAVLYVTTFLPTSLVLRVMGRDPLCLKGESDLASYWKIREVPGPGQGTMDRQF